MPCRRNFIFLPLFFALISCADFEDLVRQSSSAFANACDCVHDTDCKPNETCVEGKCIPAAAVCAPKQRPLLQIDRDQIDFGAVAHKGMRMAQIRLKNVGDCSLSVRNVNIETETRDGFTCEECRPGFLMAVAPTRTLALHLAYQANEPGAKGSALLFDTNDPSMGDKGRMRVPIFARYEGEPRLFAEPSPLHFGPLTWNPSSQVTETQMLQLSNRGTQNAVVVIESLKLEQGRAFALKEAPASDPVVFLSPYQRENKDAAFEVRISFSPKKVGPVSDVLIVGARDYGRGESMELKIPLRGETKGEPRIRASSDSILFRAPGGDPLSIGTLATEELKLFNDGLQDLVISNYSVTPLAPDFSFFPETLKPIPPGESASIHVFYAPSVLGLDRPRAKLVVASNDLGTPLLPVTLRGLAKNTQEEVLSLEMDFASARAGWAGSDYRDVDLELISPSGFSCAKPKSVFSLAGDLVRTVDYCEAWNAFGREGRARWIAPGLLERPERVNLLEFGANASPDLLYTARVHYVEDCSSMPSALLAGMLGISVGALEAYLSAQTGTPISVASPQKVSELVAKHCLSHSSTTATVRVHVNGREVASPQVQLFKKGDSANVIQIRRRGEHFEVIK